MNNHAQDDDFIVESIDFSFDFLLLHELAPAKYPYLLESVAHGPTAQFDILFAFPQEQIILRHDDISESNFLNKFHEHWNFKKKSPAHKNHQLPFRGGWFIFLGYELAQQIESSLCLPLSSGFETDLPVAFATRVPAAIVRCHKQNKIYLIAEKKFATLLNELKSDLKKIKENIEILTFNAKLHEEDPLSFLNNVERIKNYILAGDVFQVNLSREWRGEWQGPSQSPLTMYRRLRQFNPAPFAGLVHYGQSHILSSSPERLVKVTQGLIETRPIAGTRPRSNIADKDRLNASELLINAKERAEHVMLIDLERNDMGRICAPGTVQVNELMIIESYSHVHHIVSNICGSLQEHISPADVIRAVFPGGTITGCPKVRCMEIIAELENQPRGPYTGAMGYINHDGDMDLNILIRTLTLHRNHLSLRAGAGIVADSQAELELQETRFKARGLLQIFE